MRILKLAILPHANSQRPGVAAFSGNVMNT